MWKNATVEDLPFEFQNEGLYRNREARPDEQNLCVDHAYGWGNVKTPTVNAGISPLARATVHGTDEKCIDCFFCAAYVADNPIADSHRKG